MAEREGFEPSVEVSPHTRLAGERLQPTRPSLRFLMYLAVFFIYDVQGKFATPGQRNFFRISSIIRGITVNAVPGQEDFSSAPGLRGGPPHLNPLCSRNIQSGHAIGPFKLGGVMP